MTLNYTHTCVCVCVEEGRGEGGGEGRREIHNSNFIRGKKSYTEAGKKPCHHLNKPTAEVTDDVFGWWVEFVVLMFHRG